MTRVTLVHGIAQQFKGPETMLADWYPALADGLSLAGSGIDRTEVSMAFYGDLFRPSAHRGLGVPELDASDVLDELERDILLSWWEEAARKEANVPAPGARTRLRTPYVIQRALDALSHSVFFAGLGERMLIFSARQARRYLTEPAIRHTARQRVADLVTDKTRVIVSHSLGSLVAYETLCAHPEWDGLSLVTLGSPLAIRNIIFDRLDPVPVSGLARWPSSLKTWTNIADRGDIVALVKSLAPTFGDSVADVLVHNGAKAHDVRPYLTARETGAAIAAGLD